MKLVERVNHLFIDDSEMAMSLPPFLSITRDMAISDRGLQLDFVRDGDGEITGMYFSTGRINRLLLTKR